MTRAMQWGACCGYQAGDYVHVDGRIWVAIRKATKGERPGLCDAWILYEQTLADQARQIDPRIGEGL